MLLAILHLDFGNGIAVNAAGVVYVTGSTSSTDFPLASALQTTNHGGPSGNAFDGFLAELSTSGSALVFSTYLGGTDFDWANGIALDASRRAHIVGVTSSTDFPLSASRYQSSNGGNIDSFVATLASSTAVAVPASPFGLVIVLAALLVFAAIIRRTKQARSY